jgi:hypothetical protein
MQHYEQTPPAEWVTTRDIELVAAAPSGAGKGSAQKLSTLWDLECLAGLNTHQAIKTETPKLDLRECPDEPL